MHQQQIDDARNQRIAELIQQKQDIIDRAAAQKESLVKELETNRTHQQDLLDLQVGRLKTEKENLDTALQEELTRIDTERKAYEQLQDDILAAKQNRLIKEQLAVAVAEAEKAKLENPESPTGTTGGTTPPYPPPESNWYDIFKLPATLGDWFKLPSFADWEGPVPGALGQAYPAIVHGGEFISQPGRAGITQNFHISQLVVREEADVRRIARELYRLQQVRV